MPFWNDQLEARPRPLQRRVSPDNIHTVTEATFDKLVSQASGPVAVEFMSYGCVHCRAIEPILQEVAAEIAATETVFRVNIAIELDLAARYQVEGTPTFIMFLDGQEIGRSEGPRPTMSSVMAAVTQPFETRNDF
jgi:thioredoxin 1